MNLWPTPHASAPIHGAVTLSGSKSLTNRELVLGALADGPGVLRRALRSRDTELMARALGSLGATVDTSSDDWTIAPLDRRAPASEVAVDCGLAGTVMRFVPPVAALRNGAATFDGDEHARLRPMASILDSLRGLGVRVDDCGRNALPFTVDGTGSVAGGVVELDASASSQFVSALLLAGAAFDNGIEVRHIGDPIPSQPHIDMTVACLRERGVRVDDSDHNTWRVAPGPIRARDVAIEPDLSNAAPFLMLAMTSGGSITIPGWPARTTQPGDALREILASMGGKVTLDDSGLTVSGSGQISGIDIDLHDLGELTPAIAALCALADTPSRLRGIAHIRGHETDRLAALATEINGLGGNAVETSDGLEIRPAQLHGGVFHTYADHRMAHAAVIIGSTVAGVEAENIGTTAKTFPGFEAVWLDLFAGVH